MKFFNNVKKWLVTALCATFVFSGAIAVNTSVVKAVEEEPVTVSNDIQSLVNAFNAVLPGNSGAFARAEYVHDFTMTNGTKASGILITQDITASTGTGQYSSNILPLRNLTFNVSNFDGNTPMFSYILAPINGEGYDVTSPEFHIGLSNVDNKNGWSVMNNNDVDAGGTDKAGAPCNGLFLRTYNAAGNSASNLGCYYDDKAGYLIGTRGYAPISYKGNQTEPFSIYYDYATNVVYKDINKNSTHASATHRLLGFPNVAPQDFASIKSTFDTKYCGKDGFTLDAYTGSKTFPVEQRVAGFTDGKANISIRLACERQKKSTVLLTNVLGLDLTNPESTFGQSILVGDEDAPMANAEYEIKAPRYANVIGETVEGEFTGKVNVYKGERSYKYAYGSYGATIKSISEDTALTKIASEVQVGAKVDLSEIGKYTIEYIAEDGEVAYSNVTVNDGLVFKSVESYNTSVTVNGEPYVEGMKLQGGDVIKFIPENGYTLYGFDESATPTPRVVINGKKVVLNSENAIVVDINLISEGEIEIITASFDRIYTVALGRRNGGNLSNITLYGGVPANIYNYANSNAWRDQKTINGEDKAVVYTYYGLFYYNGARAYVLGTLAPNDSSPTKDTTDKMIIGYSLINTETQESVGLIKSGIEAVNSFPVKSNLQINPIDVQSYVKTAGIKTKGTLGLQVKAYIDELSYNAYKNDFVQYEKGNDFGVEGALLVDRFVSLVVVNGVDMPELAEEVGKSRSPEDAYGYYGIASKHPDKIKKVDISVDDFKLTEVINGVTYKVVSIVLPIKSTDDYDNEYYVGGVMSVGTVNGGQIIRLGASSGSGMSKHSVAAGAIKTFNSEIAVGGEGKFSYTVGDVTYTSNTLQSQEIKKVVSIYLAEIENFIVKAAANVKAFNENISLSNPGGTNIAHALFAKTYYSATLTTKAEMYVVIDSFFESAVIGVSATEVEGYVKHEGLNVYYNPEVFADVSTFESYMRRSF